MDHQIAQLEREIKTAKGLVDRSKALARLQSNPDFKEVIVKGFLEQEAIRLVHLKQHPDKQSAEAQASIVRQIDAIGVFAEFLYIVAKTGEMAEHTRASCEGALDEIRAEELSHE